eukprot:s2963_g10.t1
MSEEEDADADVEDAVFVDSADPALSPASPGSSSPDGRGDTIRVFVRVRPLNGREDFAHMRDSIYVDAESGTVWRLKNRSMLNALRPTSSLLLASLILAPCVSQVSIRTDESGGFSSGISFPEWLYQLQIEATDLTSAISTALRLQVKASLHCIILASGGSLATSFYLENATADLTFAVQPVQPPGSALSVPLGRVRVTQCKAGVDMSRPRFSGSFMFETALTQLEPALQQFVNQELPSVACAQIPPLLEAQATAALASVLTQMEPLLTGHAKLPSPPTPVGNVVDWATYPPARLLRSLIKSKPGVVADLVRRVPAQKVPLHQLHINRSLTVDALGTTFRSYLQELFAQFALLKPMS